jgi:hypothetical protein
MTASLAAFSAARLRRPTHTGDREVSLALTFAWSRLLDVSDPVAAFPSRPRLPTRWPGRALDSVPWSCNSSATRVRRIAHG